MATPGSLRSASPGSTSRRRPQQHDLPLLAYNVFENRTYKRLRVKGGEVLSMTIRELSGA